MEMPKWYREEMQMAYESKDVYLIVQLNKNWFKTLKEVEKKYENEHHEN